jgi:outer membrane PBP1 activator LpoA protein
MKKYVAIAVMICLCASLLMGCGGSGGGGKNVGAQSKAEAQEKTAQAEVQKQAEAQEKTAQAEVQKQAEAQEKTAQKEVLAVEAQEEAAEEEPQETDIVGIRMDLSEVEANTKGTLLPNPIGVFDDDRNIYVMPIYYIAMPREEASAILYDFDAPDEEMNKLN